MCAQFMMKLDAEGLAAQVRSDFDLDVSVPYELEGPKRAGGRGVGTAVVKTVVFPHRQAWVLVARPELALRAMNFSLIPSWSKTRRPRFATHNARLETARSKPTWRASFQRSRCAIPMHQFIEPIHEGPWSPNWVGFSGKSPGLLWAAGLHAEWVDRESGEIVESFAILTSEPHPFVREVGHDRQPVFLQTQAVSAWITSRSPEPVEEWLTANGPDLEWRAEKVRPLSPQN
jgi:putative SOS response-associated peptidase YedK